MLILWERVCLILSSAVFSVAASASVRTFAATGSVQWVISAPVLNGVSFGIVAYMIGMRENISSTQLWISGTTVLLAAVTGNTLFHEGARPLALVGYGIVALGLACVAWASTETRDQVLL